MKVSYINSICAKHDAISNAIKNEISLFQNVYNAEVKFYAYRCDHPDMPFVEAMDASVVAMDRHFQHSDLVIFHFGVFYPLFNLLPLIPSNIPRVVIFHNITPKKFLPEDAHEVIEKSLGQLSIMSWADHIICDSPENLRVIREHGVKTPATVVPIAVPSAIGAPEAKASFVDGRVRFGFVGRFVRSKGIHDLLVAFKRVIEHHPDTSMSLDFLGNLDFSDSLVVEEIHEFIRYSHEHFGDRVTIKLHGSAPDEVKFQILADVDIFVLPTYHEGYCVPILEAFGKGCRVVAYDNSNTPNISGGYARLVETGNVDYLTTALSDELELVTSSRWADPHNGDYKAYREQILAYCARFMPEAVDKAFLETVERILLGKHAAIA